MIEISLYFLGAVMSASFISAAELSMRNHYSPPVWMKLVLCLLWPGLAAVIVAAQLLKPFKRMSA